MSHFIIEYRRVFLLTAISLVLLGLVSLITMPKDEDPLIPKVNGMIIAVFPGATPSEMRTFIEKPLQDELVFVENIEKTRTTIRSETAIINITLNEFLTDENKIAEIWNEVRRAISRASSKFPQGVVGPFLNDDLLKKESIVIALEGNMSLIELKDRADLIKDDINLLDQIKSVEINSDPKEQISINLKDDRVSKLGIDYFQIFNQLVNSTQSIPAGIVKIDGRNIGLKTNSSLMSIDEIKSLPMILNSGDVIQLSDISTVERTILLPPTQSMTFNGKEALSLGIALNENIDLIKYGTYFNKELAKIKEKYPDVNFHVTSFFPDNVEYRIKDLGASLFQGIASLGLILILLMGIRVGLLVSLLVPVISSISLGLFSLQGGVLHQISIAAFVMALGLLVDNIIIISDSIQDKINKGVDSLVAAKDTIQEFLMPLFAATGTTIAAFVPMLLADGLSAEFTRSLALVTAITLSSSYLFSIFVTPYIASKILIPAKKSNWKFLTPVSRLLSILTTKYSVPVMISVGVILMGSMALVPILKFQFFPFADRDQLVIDIRLPEGTHYDQTRSTADSVVEKIKNSKMWQKEILNISSYVGRSTPKFFYNLNLQPNSPHIAQMLVKVNEFKNSPWVRDEIEELITNEIGDGSLIVRELEQGPPVDAAVVVKVFGKDFSEMIEVSEKIRIFIDQLESSRSVRSQLGTGLTTVKFNIDDANSLKFGRTRNQVTNLMFGRSRGSTTGVLRIDSDPIPIKIRTSEGEDISLSDFEDTIVSQTRSGIIKLKDIVYKTLDFEPTVMTYEKGKQVIKVYSEIMKGFGYNDLLSDLKPFLKTLNYSKNIEIELDGQETASLKANAALGKMAPFALFVLIFFLLIQFNSFKKSIIVISSVPISFVGVSPSHLINGFPFGFFSLLGALALIGIIVNNAILIIEFIDIRIKENHDIALSIKETLEARLRPVILTTLTTVIGLIPLATSDATLWPPFAWTIIFGLVLGSLLTIFFVPAFYYFLYNRDYKASLNSISTFILITCFAGLYPKDLSANEKLSFTQAIDMSKDSNIVYQATQDLNVSEKEFSTKWRSTYLPRIGLDLERRSANEEQIQSTPVGNIIGVFENTVSGSLYLQENLFNASDMIFRTPAIKKLIEARKLDKKRAEKISQYQTAMIYLSILETKIKINSLSELRSNLKKRKSEVRRLYKLGRVSEVDLLKIESSLDDTNQAILEFNRILPSLKLTLGKSLGLMSEKDTSEISEFIASLNTLTQKEVLGNQDTKNREDIDSLEIQIEAQKKLIKGIDSEYLPNIGIDVRAHYQNPTNFQEEKWYSAAVFMSWNIFQGATRFSRKETDLARLNQLKRNKVELERQAIIDQSQSSGLLVANQSEIDIRQKGFKRALKVVRIEFDRYKRGKSSLNDILDAEDLLKDLREKKDLVFVEFVKSHIDLQLARGDAISL